MNTGKLLGTLLLTATSSAALACDFPTLTQISADETVRESRRTLIQLGMIQYISAMSSYIECLREDHSIASDAGAPALHLSLLASRNNQAIAEINAMQTLYTAWMGPIEELAALETAQCIDAGAPMRDIVLDDRTILFYTRRDEIYLNVLAEGCPILRPNNSSLKYALTKPARFIENICVGSPLSDSTTSAGAKRCLMGQFYPISASEADELRDQ